MRFHSLSDWLRWQESLHPREIELGLDRVRTVAARLDLLQPACPVIIVGGTNGKGSTLAYLEAIYSGAGYRTGLYTSPHLIRYNERIRIGQREADDAGIMAAFEAIDRARGDISLTYFEFATLAALWLCRQAAVDVMLLEVGLGGRLDAVNILDADVAIVTSIGLDHMDWLGGTRELIAREKAGIFRAGRPAICGESDPPADLAAVARECGAHWYALNQTFGHRRGRDEHWDWWSLQREWSQLPQPSLGAGVQLDNAAAALMAIDCLQPRLPLECAAITAGLGAARLPGRCQSLEQEGVELVLDVAHNPQAAGALADWLAARPAPGRTRAVYAGLADKDVRSVTAPLLPAVDCWYVGSLSGTRARHADSVLPVLAQAGAEATAFGDVASALQAARADSRPGDRILVFGSFLTVGEALQIVGKPASVQDALH